MSTRETEANVKTITVAEFISVTPSQSRWPLNPLCFRFTISTEILLSRPLYLSDPHGVHSHPTTDIRRMSL